VFTALARFSIRFRWAIVVFWALAAIVLSRALPSLSSVVQANNAQFLPASSPSRQAAQLAAPFQASNPAGTAILVASRAGAPLTADDLAALARVEEAARATSGVESVRDGGTSRDGMVAQAIIAVSSATSSDTQKSKAVVDGIRASFAPSGAPPGLSLHLTGPLAVTVDSAKTNAAAITRLSLILVVVLLFAVYRALLAPLATLVPAAVAVLVSQPLIAELAKSGVAVTPVAQQLLIVLLIGAGSDYGLFLIFRMREELARQSDAHAALVTAVGRVGEAITFSALTVGAALITLLLAPFAIYRGLGPGLAIGILVLLAASLTLTPALLAIFGRALFWPLQPRPGGGRPPLWGRVAVVAVRHPLLTLGAAAVLFGGLTAGLTFYKTAGLGGSVPAGSDSALGQAVLTAHSPPADAGSDEVLIRFDHPLAGDRSLLETVQSQLSGAPVFASISAAQVSPDGRTLRYFAALRAGPAGSTAAASAIPAARSAVDGIARATGAQSDGIAGPDSTAADIYAASNASLLVVVPVVLGLILVLLGLLLRSLVAPWYLALTVGLSYLASLGFASLVFIRLAGSDGLIFVLPLIMFVFAMALGEDYNILVMSRLREEARGGELSEALTKAIGVTGGTVTAAGLILAGTFSVFGFAGGSTQAQQLGFSIAFGVLLDTFFVRTLLVPALARLVGRWNWWPSRLSRAA